MNKFGIAMTLLGSASSMLGSCGSLPPVLNTVLPSTQPATDLTLDLGNEISMKLVLIPAGKFMMGSPKNENGRRDDEGPQREVIITKPFYMGVYAVTMGQYDRVMGGTPEYSKLDLPTPREAYSYPVSCVSWDDAATFCKRLSERTGRTVRLPTEAQWEYACRAGSMTRFCFGDNDTELADYAWHKEIGGGGRKEGGAKRPNAWGLYDIHGNLMEWCADWYADSYANGHARDPVGPARGNDRILRGGTWYDLPEHCRSARRARHGPDTRFEEIGFRVVVELK